MNSAGKSVRILQLENSALDMELVREAVEQDGLHAEWTGARNQEEFSTALAAKDFDIILADFNVRTEFTGLDAFHLARKHSPEVPFILVTGSIGDEAAVDALRSGVTDYVLKHRLFQLGRTVHRALDDRQRRRARETAEQALLRSERMLAEAERMVHLGSYSYDTATGQVRLSDEALRILGVDGTTFSGSLDALYARIHPDDRARIRREAEEGLFRQKGVDMEHRVVPPDGCVRFVRVRMEVERAANGTPVRTMGTIQDVTEQRAFEEALRHEHATLQQVLETSPVGMLMVDPSGALEFANPQAERILGLARQGAEFGKTEEGACRRWKPGEGPLLPQPLSVETVLSTRKPLHGQQQALQRPDGTRLLLSINAAPVARADGSIQALVMSVEDITPRVMLEEQARLNEARLEGLLRISQSKATTVHQLLEEGLTEAVRLTNSHAGCLFYQDKTQHFFKLGACVPAPTWCQGCTDMPETYQLQQLGLWAEAATRRQPVVFNNGVDGVPPSCLELDGGAPLHRFLSIPLLGSHENVVGVVGVANKPSNYDASDTRQLALLMDAVWKLVERRRAEEEREQLAERIAQAQKMEALGQMAGGLAHDFNNLLGAILGYSSFALTDLGADHPVADDLREIQLAGERAAGLTRQLLVFARQKPIEPSTLDVNACIRNVTTMLRRLIGEHVRMEVNLADTPQWTTMDPCQLEQILMNLAVNARDAMPQGGRLVICTTQRELDTQDCLGCPALAPGDHVELTVQDTGCGIPAEIQQRVFEPFFTTKPIGKGTGLGLAMVYGAVTQAHGHITLRSVSGQGTTFTILLPQVEQSPSNHATVTPEPLKGSHGEHVLLVEDEDQLRAVAARVLRNHGYHVTEATNGIEALRIYTARSRDFHLVLSDVVMPGMGGVELVKRIWEENPRQKVLLATGYADDPLNALVCAPQPPRVIQKPLVPVMLLRMVRRVLDDEPADPPAQSRG